MGNYEIETLGFSCKTENSLRFQTGTGLIWATLKRRMECKPDIIHISVPVSYVMIYSKLNKNKTWVMKNLAICVEYALEHGYEVTVGFEDASRADITFMIILAQQLKQRGVSRIRFADTVGILSPGKNVSGCEKYHG
jgi:homocitrate synthase NifV